LNCYSPELWIRSICLALEAKAGPYRRTDPRQLCDLLARFVSPISPHACLCSCGRVRLTQPFRFRISTCPVTSPPATV